MTTSEILRHLHIFFPDNKYSSSNIEEYVESDELDTSPASLANTLQGALLDETILEVQILDLKEIFFCRVLDNPFEMDLADENGNLTSPNSDYETGAYLHNHQHLFITPLEPSKGNYLITAFQKSDIKILLRIISSGKAIEICTFFDQKTLVGDMPSLQLAFPLVAKRTTEAREFRAKVPKGMKINVTIDRVKKKSIITTPLNISLNGMSLLDPMERRSNLRKGEVVVCSIQVPREDPILVEAMIIHVTNLRDANGIQFCFGIQFKFKDRRTKSAIESVMAVVQRAHLRELYDIEAEFGVYFDKD